MSIDSSTALPTVILAFSTYDQFTVSEQSYYLEIFQFDKGI